MDTENVDVRDLMESSLVKAYRELDEMKDDNDAKAKKLNEIKIKAEIMNAYDKNDQERLNNNAKNNNDEERIKIEQAKVKNDHKRIVLGWGEVAIGVLAGFGINFSSFLLSEHMQADKPIQRWADKCYEFLKPKSMK